MSLEEVLYQLLKVDRRWIFTRDAQRDRFEVVRSSFKLRTTEPRGKHQRINPDVSRYGS
jgi:hypothetical protein